MTLTEHHLSTPPSLKAAFPHLNPRRSRSAHLTDLPSNNLLSSPTLAEKDVNFGSSDRFSVIQLAATCASRSRG